MKNDYTASYMGNGSDKGVEPMQCVVRHRWARVAEGTVAFSSAVEEPGISPAHKTTKLYTYSFVPIILIV